MTDALRNIILKDFWLKFFSLALATLTWFVIDFFHNPESFLTAGIPLTTERTFPELPVVILSSAEDVHSFRVEPKEAEVTVQGEPEVLRNLSAKDIRVLVDLTGIGAARDLRKRIEVSTPSGVTHVRVYPQEVQVIFPPKS